MRGILVFGLLAIAISVSGCRTTKERGPAEAMQMPPRPAETARIVLFRTDDVTNARAPVPLIAINGETVGEQGDETLFIRDVPPGAQEITLALRPTDTRDNTVLLESTLRAELNAGGAWFIQTKVAEPCTAGTKPVNYNVPTGTASGDGLLAGFNLASTMLAYATMTCGATYRLDPVWPKATWHISPLLAKYGALPLVPVEIPDIRLPKSDLPWPMVEKAVRRHLDSNTVQYTPFLDKEGRGNLLIDTIAFTSDDVGADATVLVSVLVEYLHVDEKTIAGRYVKRPLRYTLRRENDTVTVVSWAEGN